MPKELTSAGNLPAEHYFNLHPHELIDGTPATANDWQSTWRAIGLPENPRGLSILDVGGGASDATAELLARGADAYAIDPKYKNRWQLDKNARAVIEAERKFNIVPPEGIDARHATLKRMLESMSANPQRYIAATSLGIPFDEGKFDIVFSAQCITSKQDIHLGLLQHSVKECLRVTKPGSQVILAPFGVLDSTLPPEVGRQIIENHSILLRELDKGVRARVVPLSPTFQRLVLTKPKPKRWGLF